LSDLDGPLRAHHAICDSCHQAFTVDLRKLPELIKKGKELVEADQADELGMFISSFFTCFDLCICLGPFTPVRANLQTLPKVISPLKRFFPNSFTSLLPLRTPLSPSSGFKLSSSLLPRLRPIYKHQYRPLPSHTPELNRRIRLIILH
jgi:hypothetical protein